MEFADKKESAIKQDQEQDQEQEQEQEQDDRSEDESGGSNDEDWVEDDEEIEVKSLFSEFVLTSIGALIQYDIETFGFDLKKPILEMSLDEMSIIMLINYIRTSHRDATTIDSSFFSLLEEGISSKEFLNVELYMKPVIESDPLLYLLADHLNLIDEDDEEEEKLNEKAKIDRLGIPESDHYKEIMDALQ